jgi:hypothetical protein
MLLFGNKISFELFDSKTRRVNSLWDNVWMIIAIIVVLLCIYVRIRVLGVPLERDEGEYAYMSQLMLKGFPPYTHAYTMKLPGVSGIYALFMSIFGQTPVGIHMGLLIVNIISVVLIYLLSKRLLGRDAAFVSCASYAIFSVSQSVLGVFAHATHFVVLFALSGFELLFRYLYNKRTTILFGSGLCFGMAFIMKQHAALFILCAITYLCYSSYSDRKSVKLPAGILFVLGTIIPYACIVIYLVAVGEIARFWFWTVLYAREYVVGIPFSDGVKVFRHQFASVIEPQAPLWLLAGGGLLLLCARQLRDSGTLFILLFLLFSFFAICPGFYFREHYFVLLLPAVALLVGAAITHIEKLMLLSNIGYHRIITSLIFSVMIVFGVVQEREYFFTLHPSVELSRTVYGLNPFPEAIPVARYVKRHTSSDDRIAVFGSEPELFFYADRISATGHIYMYGMMEDQPFAEQIQREMIHDIETAQPKFLILTEVSSSWLVRPSSPRIIFDWLNTALSEKYEKVPATEYYDASMPGFRWDVYTVFKRKV